MGNENSNTRTERRFILMKNNKTINFVLIMSMMLVMSVSVSAIDTFIGPQQSYFNGSVGIGTSSPTQELEVTGDTYSTVSFFSGTIPATGAANNLCYTTGSPHQFGSCSSLAKYKTDIENIDSALNIVDSLTPRKFTWSETGEGSYGFIAEEVEAVDSRLATYNNGELTGVKYSEMSAVNTKAIQELKSENDDLRAELDEIKTLLQNNICFAHN